ncbi:hypothetical protein [Psychrobacter alimentarius]|uniref:hypothetical protein n=1 Tax=Psychrobacter alimentarius TaxID=261164 RepID=UPI0019192597|nr:hypothetical protein [Psychrobacter alimentarius]
MKFEDYYCMRRIEERGLKSENVSTNKEYTDLLDEYRQIDDIILDFHNNFYVFEDFSNKIYTFILLIVMVFLVLSFSSFSFLSLSIASLEFFKYFFDIPVEKNIIIKKWYISIGSIAISAILFACFLFLRDKGYQSSYYKRLLKTDKTNNEYTSKGFNRFKDFAVRDYRIHWINCLFAPKDIEHVFETYNSYVNHKDDLDQVISVNTFLSNKFVKGVFTVFTTGGIGFLASYNANVQSKSPDFFSKNPQFFFNLSFMIFYALLFVLLIYFIFYLTKDLFFNFIDLFRKNSEVTQVRKNRLVYYIHQSRVLRVRGKYRKLINNPALTSLGK